MDKPKLDPGDPKGIVLIAVGIKSLSVFVDGEVYETHTYWSYDKPSIAREVWHKYAQLAVNKQDFDSFAKEMKNAFPGKAVILYEYGVNDGYTIRLLKGEKQ